MAKPPERTADNRQELGGAEGILNPLAAGLKPFAADAYGFWGGGIQHTFGFI
jgi:hypothetical protein